jgi:hypothetical protein
MGSVGVCSAVRRDRYSPARCPRDSRHRRSARTGGRMRDHSSRLLLHGQLGAPDRPAALQGRLVLIDSRDRVEGVRSSRRGRPHSHWRLTLGRIRCLAGRPWRRLGTVASRRQCFGACRAPPGASFGRLVLSAPGLVSVWAGDNFGPRHATAVDADAVDPVGGLAGVIGVAGRVVDPVGVNGNVRHV